VIAELHISNKTAVPVKVILTGSQTLNRNQIPVLAPEEKMVYPVRDYLTRDRFSFGVKRFDALEGEGGISEQPEGRFNTVYVGKGDMIFCRNYTLDKGEKLDVRISKNVPSYLSYGRKLNTPCL
jgi:hypothetical protein